MRLEPEDFFGDKDAWNETEKYLDRWDTYKDFGVGLGYYSKSQGTGKTFLATYVARELIKRGESAYYVYFRDIVPLFNKPYEVRASEENRIKNSEVLVLDEVVPAISSSQRELFAVQLEELIRYRSNWQKVTILTTNLTQEKLDKEYPRTFSLLTAKEKHIEVEGSDHRQEIWSVNESLIEKCERRPIS